MEKNYIIPCIVGIGHIGLPILLRLNKKFNTAGHNLNEDKIHFLKKNFNIYKGKLI